MITPYTSTTNLEEPGVYSGVPEHVYHGLTRTSTGRLYCSSSRLNKALSESFYAAKWEMDHRPQKLLDTSSGGSRMRMGTALHIMLLEPSDEHRIQGFDSFRSKADKEAAEQLVREGGVPVSRSQAYTIERFMYEGMPGLPEFAKTLLGMLTHRELTIIHEVEGVLLKSRIDGVSTHGKSVIDLKTGKVLDPEDRQRKLGYGLDLQAALYHDAVAETLFEPEEFSVVGLTQDLPLEGSVDVIDPYVLEKGRERYIAGLRKWKECEETGVWPIRNAEVGTLMYSEWQARRVEQELQA